jgi:hypothetical protein
MADEQLLRCADCGTSMRRVEEVLHPTAKCRFLEFYQCNGEACQRKLVLQWEKSDGTLSEEEESFVEREVRLRGSWFPSDYSER